MESHLIPPIDMWQSLKMVFEWAWGFMLLVIKTMWPAWPIFLILILIVIFKKLALSWIYRWRRKT